MTIKLVALDIDGTLLTSDGRVTPEVFEAIQEAKAQGVHVVLATGRPRSGVLHLLKELQLAKNNFKSFTLKSSTLQKLYINDNKLTAMQLDLPELELLCAYSNELSELLAIIDSKNTTGMKSYLEKIRKNLRNGTI